MSSVIRDIARDLWTIREDNERYRVYDLSLGPRSTLSRTVMNAHQETRGHTHPHAEVLTVESGWGLLLTGHKDDPQVASLGAGDVVMIEPGEWHRVTTENQPLVFICFFEGSRARNSY
ncbi:hypothetical protein LCGC14_1882490 [marine sediment metagenome]|uniref:Cupin type-2 domain-containing protein n=1 Tax=marine sediment metagenome TaxID=412755 RepID=A0A0F9GQ54_9ZZZZ